MALNLEALFSTERRQPMRSFLRKTSIPVSASPRRATVEPPSGTSTSLAENEKLR